MISVCYFDLVDYFNDHYVFHVDSIYNRHFLPYGRADLTASALLQRICGGQPQLHPLRLASTVTSTRE
jgi:hypothetical protein